jgi:hypothetical protein
MVCAAATDNCCPVTARINILNGLVSILRVQGPTASIIFRMILSEVRSFVTAFENLVSWIFTSALLFQAALGRIVVRKHLRGIAQPDV